MWLREPMQGAPAGYLAGLAGVLMARSVNAVAGRSRGTDHSEVLVDALEIDMVDWWAPSHEDFFSQIRRSHSLKVLKEAAGHDATHATRKMNGKTFAKYCAHLMQDVRWVPAPLRRVVCSHDTGMSTGHDNGSMN